MFDKGKSRVTSDNDQMKEWLGLLDDKERAEVLKVQIAENAQTERVRLEQQGQTDRDDDVIVGKYWVRGAWAFVALVAVACSTCAGYRHIEARQAVDSARIQAEHPVPTAGANPAPK